MSDYFQQNVEPLVCIIGFIFFLVAVTIYVKKEEEKVYNALMLDSLTVGDMVEAVSNLSSIYDIALYN